MAPSVVPGGTRARALLKGDCFKKWLLNEAMKKAKKRAKLVFELRLLFVKCERSELLSYATYVILRTIFKRYIRIMSLGVALGHALCVLRVGAWVGRVLGSVGRVGVGACV